LLARAGLAVRALLRAVGLLPLLLVLAFRHHFPLSFARVVIIQERAGGSGARPLTARADRLDAPDLLGVLADGAVRRELAHRRDVVHRLPGPELAVPVARVDPALRGDIGRVVGEQEVAIAILEERADERPEEVGLFGAE